MSSSTNHSSNISDAQPQPQTHERLNCWLESATTAGTEFPIYNLPYGAFIPRSSSSSSNSSSIPSTQPHLAVAIGTYALDLHAAVNAGLLNTLSKDVQHSLLQPTLNTFMSLSVTEWTTTRKTLQNLLSGDDATSSSPLHQSNTIQQQCLIPLHDIQLVLAVHIGDYTDFYCSEYHAYNCGVMFRGPANALQPNFKQMPIGYHGRASSIVVSGTPITRPVGQVETTKGSGVGKVTACQRLDFELEFAAFIGGPTNPLGERVSVDTAATRLFGYSLMNDWSARDVQVWEMVPLGPFNAKNFATSLSPWIVTADALAPFKVQIKQTEPMPQSYLIPKSPHASFSFDLSLQVDLQSAAMRQRGDMPHTISRSNARHLYWSFSQMLAHHTLGGCNFRAGDLIGSGTISGPTDDSLGSMLELSWGGSRTVKIGGAGDGDAAAAIEERKFLNDGDAVTFTADARHTELGYTIGFGRCTGVVQAARSTS